MPNGEEKHTRGEKREGRRKRNEACLRLLLMILFANVGNLRGLIVKENPRGISPKIHSAKVQGEGLGP